MTFEELALPSASVEVNIAKLSVLISRFLTSLCRCAVSSSTQKVFFHALEEWASSLPQDLDHVPDVDHSLSSESNKVGVVSQSLKREISLKLTAQAIPGTVLPRNRDTVDRAMYLGIVTYREATKMAVQ